MSNRGAFLFSLLSSMFQSDYIPQVKFNPFRARTRSSGNKMYHQKGHKHKHGATNPGLRRLWRANIGKGYDHHKAFAKPSKRYRWSELEAFWAKVI